MRFFARARLFRTLMALLRLATYVVFVFLVAGFLAARVLRADIKEAALAGGHQLAVLADLVGEAETIELNGEVMHHSSTYTDQTIGTVLDRLEGYCASSPGLGGALRDLPKTLAAKVERMPRSFRLGFLRAEEGGRGFVACFVDDPGGSYLREFTERVRRFVQTRRLGEFGKFLYAFAELGGQGQTHVVVTWADTDLDIGGMFPSTGDAAGTDSPVLPRPPHARRTLSAGAEGMPYGLRIYQSTDGAESLKKFYDDWMTKNQFTRVTGAVSRHGSAYLREGFQVFVAIGEQHGRTSVSLIEAGNPDGTSITSVEVSE
jgi:hypothetical protein